MPKLQPKEIWKVDLPDTQAHEQMGRTPSDCSCSSSRIRKYNGCSLYQKIKIMPRFPYTYLGKKIRHKRSYLRFSSPNISNAAA